MRRQTAGQPEEEEGPGRGREEGLAVGDLEADPSRALRLQVKSRAERPGRPQGHSMPQGPQDDPVRGRSSSPACSRETVARGGVGCELVYDDIPRPGSPRSFASFT